MRVLRFRDSDHRSLLMISRILLLAMCFLVGTGFADKPAKLKHVSLDEFMSGDLAVSIPLQLSVPVQYDHVELPSAGTSYHYWMLKSEATHADATGDLPGDSGYMYAKISENAVYRSEKGVFRGLEDMTADEQAEFSAVFSDVHMERCKAGKFPALLLTLTDKKTGYRIHNMYVATLIDTNVVFIALIAPHKHQEIGDLVWADIRRGLACPNP